VRVGVADIGTNSTRLLIADVQGGRVVEVDRRSEVTRLGEGVDSTGRLGDAPIARVTAALDEYHAALEASACDATVGVLTSAVRDATNGAEFTRLVCERYGIDARTIDGDTEARLTFLGATAGRPRGDAPLLVVDIGGGSTELVVGSGGTVSFHVSTQAGVVRQTERHLHADPPSQSELEALGAEVRDIVSTAVPGDVRDASRDAVAVAGTATSCAAIDLALDPYDPRRVEGHVLDVAALEGQLARLAALPLDRRRDVVGLHPDRAPTIVAGVVILIEVLRLFELSRVTVSEHDILWGAALERATRD